MAYVIVPWVSTLVLSATKFINRFFFIWVDCSKSARNEEPSSRIAFNGGLASGDSGLQLNLEIAQAVSQRRLSLSTGFQAGRKCVEASDDVIEADLTSIAGIRNGTLVQYA